MRENNSKLYSLSISTLLSDKQKKKKQKKNLGVGKRIKCLFKRSDYLLKITKLYELKIWRKEIKYKFQPLQN